MQIYTDTNLTLPLKGQRTTYDHHLNKLGSAETAMLYQDSAPKLSSFWRRRFLSVFFLPYIDMAAILFNGAEPFENIGNTLSTEVPI